MNAQRTIPLRFSPDMLMAKTILIPCEILRRLAGSSGAEPFNRGEGAFRHARVITIHEPEADGKLTTVAVAVGNCWIGVLCADNASLSSAATAAKGDSAPATTASVGTV